MNSIKTISTLDKISSFMLLFFPAALVAGPFIAELIMNLISLFFIVTALSKKNFSFLKNKFFLFFIIFFIYILVNSYYSTYKEIIFYKNIFYLRFIIFAFAISALLSINNALLKQFYKFLMLTVMIVVVDGYIQYFFGQNTLGFPKYRADRLSGFFDDELIIGSYLSRLLPLMLGLFFLNLKFLNKNEKILSIFIFYLTFILIFLSGERSATIVSFILVGGFLIFIDYSKKVKITFFRVIILSTVIILFISPKILNRQYTQFVNQVNLSFSGKTFFSNFLYYEGIYQTAFNGFMDKKIIGQGAKSYRFFCSVNGIEHKTMIVARENINEVMKLRNIDLDSAFLVKNNIRLGQNYKRNDILLVYRYWKKFEDPQTFRESYIDNELKILAPKDLKIVDVELTAYRLYEYMWRGKTSCTTHPHNFYLQLLAETGIIGLSFIIILSLYLFMTLINKKKKHNFEICLLIGFLLTLIPFLPNGNFFNNWLNMIMFLPIGFYINYLELKKSDK